MKIDSSNMADTYYGPDDIKQGMFTKQVDNIKPGRDRGFASDAVKNNVEQIVRQLSPHRDVKAI